MVDYCKLKMSGSEEEFESQIQSGMSKAELRRSNKPIMEKRRRARINQCLEELKSLILEAMKKDPSRHSKLEKADILEMTVKHLQTVQRQQLSTAVATDPAVLTKFRTGFSECANEVSRYVNHLENVDSSVKQRLVSHLNNCVNNLQQMAPFYSHFVPYMPERLFPEVKVGFQSDFHSGDENNNASARIQIPSGVQLIPSRLPTGELALLVPQSAGISANFPFFPPASETSRVRTSSAFTPVQQRSHSPLLSPSTSTSSFGEDSHHQDHFRQSDSPNYQHRFKIPEQSPASSKSFSSPETQKPHISSTSDRKSPVSAFSDPKHNGNSLRKESINQESSDFFVNGAKGQNIRQPLSVITDKTYNRAPIQSTKRENLKRHHSDGLLVISDKRPKLQEAQSSTASICNTVNGNTHRIRDEKFSSSMSVEDLSQKNNSVLQNVNGHISCPSGSSGSQSNGDMWRPW
ncbi:protein deadpan-like [Chelonus insularis]|uniref:protein deadpan-like n=1 Tax=Chelonus insularis TaxID=460826 RepID=UPI00158E5F52|nr:protein deadpan-like [Chelonus insularis]